MLTKNKAFLSNFNVSQKPAASSLQGKIRVRQTRESPRKPVILRRPRNTANNVSKSDPLLLDSFGNFKYNLFKYKPTNISQILSLDWVQY